MLDLVSTKQRLRLFCLAHAGGTAMPYAAWSRRLPGDVVPTPIDLPGHGSRMGRPPHTELGPLLAELASMVSPLIDSRYVLFGHSLGAMLGYELARLLRDRGTPPELLMVAAHNGPGTGRTHQPIHDLPDERFVDALIRLGGTPAAIREQPELLRMYLPLLRADLRIAERYHPLPGQPLACPVVAFAGRADRMTDQRRMLGWLPTTTAACELVFLDGAHFFVSDPRFVHVLATHLPAPAGADALTPEAPAGPPRR
jgi:medium-chain acyl-[acyl-carrier-protein] hydrolase